MAAINNGALRKFDLPGLEHQTLAARIARTPFVAAERRVAHA